ncbi:MAG: response regulator receiver modulated PilZ sensor protein [Myxococcales bacterium]|nr:response regulator receiver modulated PilZ sensor protein [Myxococcales bacterium]
MSDTDDRTSSSDQRKHERLPVRLIVDYEGADDFMSDYTENLSTGGTFIHTSRVLERETTVMLVLSFPGLLEPISLQGIVRWSRGGKQPGIGVEFVPGPDRAKLEALVARIEQRDPSAVARVIRILVVEDNRHISEMICSGLGASAKRTFGDALAFHFATAENGALALELLRTTAFDLAIIDLYLPVVGGAEVIDHARGELGLVDLPIIAMSAGGDPARSSALAAGANLFLEKPMRLREVLHSMRQLVKLSA